ncbi:MAG: 3-phosphoshikimate 1-carboxyvinyltransferase [Dehalococcoidia bacterium]|nr:3-phosphoshikimate 1-carboxyvinyltransferase [Dehalococcoidia bacterium]
MQQTVRRAHALRGTIVPPGDKSISHRAALFNAIARGEAVVENFQRGADCLATLRCLRRLGVSWSLDESSLRIKGAGRGGLREPEAVLDCRNSGTTMRLLSGLLAAQPFFSVLTGDASLRSRPMARVIDPLLKMGARIHGRDGDTKAPLAIRGAGLRGLHYRLPVASAQVKSALILAGLYAEGETTLEEPAPTRDHTERMLQAMGASVTFGEGPAVTVRPLAAELSPLSLRVPGDISAAAPWLVLGALHPDAEIRIAGVSVNPTRTGILDALAMMGADISIEEQRQWGPEPVADLVVRSSRLQGMVIGGDLVPRAIDELPLLALAGCLAQGETLIKDASELRLKESDRIRTTAAGLRRLGARVDETPDGMRIAGGQALRGATVSSYGDHRLAMMLAVAGGLADGETVVHKSQSVAVSYPWFWSDLEALPPH